MKFVVLKHVQPLKQVPFPRRRYLQMMAESADKATTGAAVKGHDVHYDLMLQTEEGLQTWAMGLLPAAGKRCGAIKLPLHREFYLTHEGPVSSGRGTVERVLKGHYQWQSSTLILDCGRQSLSVEMDEIQKDHFRFSFSQAGQSGTSKPPDEKT